MKKTFKKITASIMAVTTLAVSIVGMSANAANTTDNPINNFYVRPGTGGWERLYDNDYKSNTTPVYLYVTTSTRDFRVQTLGVNSSGAYNCTYSGNSVYCEKNKEYLIHNYIKENGYLDADLQFYSTSYYNPDYLTGNWSPDSVRENGHTYYDLY